jgi:signal transduction histidine kinase
VLARRVTRGNDVLIQGVWLDWPKLKDWLTRSAADLLPEMSLVAAAPNGDVASQRLLATLPVELVVPPLAIAPASIAPLGLPLLAAWLSLALAAVAVAALLFGVVRLSERRAAFVSAVTHELRTPLTTFRLYTDMLSQGLVTDEARRGEYIDTLHAEADRLGHLVENVLSFARLERRGKLRRRETTTIGRLLDDAVERLSSRAGQAELAIETNADPATRDATVVVDPAAVEQILFNLVDNACKYAAAATDRRLHLDAQVDGNAASIRLRDHGPGIAAKLAREVFRPFSRPADSAHPNVPGVGLGLALSRRLARSMNGDLLLARGDGGAEFELRLPLAPR